MSLLSLKPIYVLFLAPPVGLFIYKLCRRILFRAKTTRLCGPPSNSWLFGVRNKSSNKDPADLYETWADRYGSVFLIPSVAGSKNLVVCDPKAIAHFYAGETTTYVKSAARKAGMELGRGVLWADGDDHKRQRRAMTPAFSNASIRNFTPIFYDSAYKLKDTWDTFVASSPNGEAIIEVQTWMNHVSLDSIGIAGFSHDFGSLRGKHSEIVDILDAFASSQVPSVSDLIHLVARIFPNVRKLPTERVKLRWRLHTIMGEIAEELLKRTVQEKEMTGDFKYSAGQSIIGALIKAEYTDGELSMSHEEVLAQMNVLMIAGYETTSISMTWALYELAKQPDKQEKLRAELENFTTIDPTYDQLTNSLPYLNAVVREILRLHPPVQKTTRIAAHDDVMPVSEEILTHSGTPVDRIFVGKGTTVTIPIRTMNRSTSIWGTDAKEFVPERWINEAGLTEKAKEIHGFSHLLTFVDGARMCLGKGFALAEFKAVLSVLIRNYRFALRDGPDTQIQSHRALLNRPSVAGEDGAKMPLRVSRA